MNLKDVLVWLKGLDIKFEHYYLGFLETKHNRSLGVYNLKRKNNLRIAIGGIEYTSYNVKQVSLLIHWNEAFDESESKAIALYNSILEAAPSKIGNYNVNYIQLLTNEPVDVGRDQRGICEFVIEFEINYKRNKEG